VDEAKVRGRPQQERGSVPAAAHRHSSGTLRLLPSSNPARERRPQSTEDDIVRWRSRSGTGAMQPAMCLQRWSSVTRTGPAPCWHGGLGHGGSKRRTKFVPLGRRNRVPVRRPWAESPLKKSRRPCLSLRLFGSGLGQRSSPRIRDRKVVQNWSAAYTLECIRHLRTE
jgi:hypothetical protein